MYHDLQQQQLMYITHVSPLGLFLLSDNNARRNENAQGLIS